MNVLSQMAAEYKDGNVIITLPMSLLRFAQAHREDPLSINDPQKAGEYIAKSLIEFDTDEGSGNSRFEQLLDDLFLEAYEGAEPWLFMLGEDGGI